MKDHVKTILVLGSYGHAGCKIIKGLLEKTPFQVLATGRRIEKLTALKDLHSSERLTIAVLDVNQQGHLKHLCQQADLIINAVGPYSMGGIETTKVVLACKKPYIDLANEQLHLNNLRKIKKEIELSENMVFTCTGQSPGISTLLMIHLANISRKAEDIEMYGVVGRLPTPDQSLGSLMSGVIEAAMDSTTYVNGKHVREEIGSYVKPHTIPEPFGTMKMLSFPLNDAILVPEAVSCKSVRNLFGIEMEIPPLIFKMIAWLKPHKRKWAYRILENRMKKTLKDNYQKGLKEGFNPGGYMKVVVTETDSNAIHALIKVEDNSVMSSYMPIVIALNYFENPHRFRGLLTPADVYTFETFNNELEKLGWKIQMQLN